MSEHKGFTPGPWFHDDGVMGTPDGLVHGGNACNTVVVVLV
jgi:hypothetical protein